MSLTTPALVLVCVAGTGALGGALRYLLARFPGGLTGTWLANMGGSLAAGVAFGIDGIAHTALAAGFAGALSTLSTLVAEFGGLAKARRWWKLAGYTAATVIGGLVFAGLGLWLSQ